jgi:hypothetical protein
MKKTEDNDNNAPSHGRAAWLADGASVIGLAAIAWSNLLLVASGPNYTALMAGALLGSCIGTASMLLGLKYGTPRINGVRRVLLVVGVLTVLFSLLGLVSVVYGP